MRCFDGRYLCAPSDLVRFLGCAHATYLDVVDLETPLARLNAQSALQVAVRELSRDIRKRTLGDIESCTPGGRQVRFSVAGGLDQAGAGGALILQILYVIVLYHIIRHHCICCDMQLFGIRAVFQALKLFPDRLEHQGMNAVAWAHLLGPRLQAIEFGYRHTDVKRVHRLLPVSALRRFLSLRLLLASSCSGRPRILDKAVCVGRLPRWPRKATSLFAAAHV